MTDTPDENGISNWVESEANREANERQERDAPTEKHEEQKWRDNLIPSAIEASPIPPATEDDLKLDLEAWYRMLGKQSWMYELIRLAHHYKQEAERGKSYLCTCPWCGAAMRMRPVSYQINHIITCGDEKVEREREQYGDRITTLEAALREMLKAETLLEISAAHDNARRALTQTEENPTDD